MEKVMKRLVLSLAAMALAAGAWAGRGLHMSVQVSDKNGAVVSGAYVVAKNGAGQRTAYTNAFGSVDLIFQSMGTGKYTVKVTHIGCQDTNATGTYNVKQSSSVVSVATQLDCPDTRHLNPN